VLEATTADSARCETTPLRPVGWAELERHTPRRASHQSRSLWEVPQELSARRRYAMIVTACAEPLLVTTGVIECGVATA